MGRPDLMILSLGCGLWVCYLILSRVEMGGSLSLSIMDIFLIFFYVCEGINRLILSDMFYFLRVWKVDFLCIFLMSCYYY